MKVQFINILYTILCGVLCGTLYITQKANAYSINPNHSIDEDFQKDNANDIIIKIDATLWENGQINNLTYFNFMEKTCYHRFFVTYCLDEFRLLMKQKAKEIKQEELSYQKILQEHQRKIRYYQVNKLSSDNERALASENLLATQYQQALFLEKERKKQQEQRQKYSEKQLEYAKKHARIQEKEKELNAIEHKNLLKPLPVFNK